MKKGRLSLLLAGSMVLQTACGGHIHSAAGPGCRCPIHAGCDGGDVAAACWAALSDKAQEIILTPEEIETFNADTYIASGTMVMNLRTAAERFDGHACNKMIKSSATAKHLAAEISLRGFGAII